MREALLRCFCLPGLFLKSKVKKRVKKKKSFETSGAGYTLPRGLGGGGEEGGGGQTFESTRVRGPGLPQYKKLGVPRTS